MRSVAATQPGVRALANQAHHHLNTAIQAMSSRVRAYAPARVAPESTQQRNNNLWNDPAHAETRFRLVLESFDQTAFAVDLGSAQTLNY